MTPNISEIMLELLVKDELYEATDVLLPKEAELEDMTEDEVPPELRRVDVTGTRTDVATGILLEEVAVEDGAKVEGCVEDAKVDKPELDEATADDGLTMLAMMEVTGSRMDVTPGRLLDDPAPEDDELEEPTLDVCIKIAELDDPAIEDVGIEVAELETTELEDSTLEEPATEEICTEEVCTEEVCTVDTTPEELVTTEAPIMLLSADVT